MCFFFFLPAYVYERSVVLNDSRAVWKALTLLLSLMDPSLGRQCFCSALPATEGRVGLREYF